MSAEILGVHVDCVTMTQAIEKIDALIKQKKPSLVATANAEMLMLATQDLQLKNILNLAAMVVPDGAGTVWAARHLGFECPERVAGVDLVTNLLKKNYRAYFFGAAEGVAKKAAEKFQNVAGVRNGFFSKDDEPQIISDINSANADILLVGLGVPKQEKWIFDNLDKLNVPVSIGVGGTFDVLAGNVKRAPGWMQRAKLEWLFRAMLQPSRAGRLIALPKFVFEVHNSKSDK